MPLEMGRRRPPNQKYIYLPLNFFYKREFEELPKSFCLYKKLKEICWAADERTLCNLRNAEGLKLKQSFACLGERCMSIHLTGEEFMQAKYYEECLENALGTITLRGIFYCICFITVFSYY